MTLTTRIAEALRGFLDDFENVPATSDADYVRYWQSRQDLPTIGELVQVGDFADLCRASAIAPRPFRTEHPIQIHDAGRLADLAPEELDVVNVVELFKSNRRLRRSLDRMLIKHGHGPDRGDGDFGLLYLAHTHSGEPRLHRWWRQVHGHHRLWRACGFTGPCSYPLLSERFAELEQFAHLFLEMVNQLVQAARRHEPMIGAFITVDGTECESHSRLHHACPDGFECPDRNKSRKSRARMLDASAAAKQRQAAGDLSADEVKEIFKNEGRIVPLAQVTGRPENGLRVRLTDGTILRAWEGHLYSCRDEDAGFRSYEGKQGWLGYMHIKAVDVATGLPVAQLAVSASVQEFKALPDIYDHVVQATGINPIAVGADRGYGFREVYEFLARNDSGAVIPYRIPGKNGAPEPQETKYADIHGVPKCPGCGEPGDIVKAGQGRLVFTCALAPHAACDGIHSISVSKDPLSLVLLPRTSTAYGAVRAAVQTNEQAHQFMREHFAVGGKTLSDRLRRTGLAAQQLRSNAALAITWLLALRRLGWLNRCSDECEPVVTSPLPIGRYTKGVRAKRRSLSMFGGSAPTRGAPSERATA